MDLIRTIQQKRLFFDGGMGTMLQAAGLTAGENPTRWCLSRPEEVLRIHRAYREAGCSILTTNTFSANPLNEPDYREICLAAIRLARQAAGEDGFVAFDIGPCGKLLAPLGDLSFDDAADSFAALAAIADEGGADVILIETMNDSLETKAAVVGAKSASSLPIFVTNVYDASGKLMTGADHAAMSAMLEGLGVAAYGVNCSLGPVQMYASAKALTELSSLPVIVSPNAGMPRVEQGKTVYDISPVEFAEAMERIASLGCVIPGGCCGTTPEYLAETVRRCREIPYPAPTPKRKTVISSYTHSVEIGKTPVLIGERINPTGKKKLKEALASGDLNYILNEGIRQSERGVEILDVNVGVPGLDEASLMEQCVTGLQAILDLPLQIDTADPEALERGARYYNGKPLINSVNGRTSSMDAVFPVVKRYGGAVIALTMDENGIPETAEGRLAIAERIVRRAENCGIDRRDLIVDPLALTVSSSQSAARVTLEAIRLIRERLGVYVSLGVSNISFGLPKREIINTAFFTMALENGLNCAIMNPFSEPMMDAYHAFLTLREMDPACERYLTYCTSAEEQEPVSETLCSSVKSGLQDAAAKQAADMIAAGSEPLALIREEIIPALNEVGQKFEQKTLFLPQLLMSAEAATAAFSVIKDALPKGHGDSSRKVILATVQGDIHDIGKNIVRVLLESFGFSVIDLGRDVPPQSVLDAAQNSGCRLIGLSALMTTTVPAMQETIRLLKEHLPDVKVAVGGAVLTQEYADAIGADCYSPEAMATVRYAEQYYKTK